jgi:hydroxymethylpyrimidine pyrophosphatase-like HAD family hydrolase
LQISEKTIVKSGYKLVVSDLDGTLPDKNMRISDENHEYIRKMNDTGIKFAISSDRTLSEIIDRVEIDDLIRYIAYSKGAAVYDAIKQEKIASFEMNSTEIDKIFAVLDGINASCAVHIGGKSYFERKKACCEAFNHHRINEYYRRIILMMNMCDDVELLSRESGALESVVVFFASDDKIDKAREALAADGRFAISSSVPRS